jgi:hypothetical protein
MSPSELSTEFNTDQSRDAVLAHAMRDEAALPAAPGSEAKDVHRVYIIWPFRHISHKTETGSPELAIAAFVQLMRMRHKSFYAIGVGWETNGKLKKYLDFSSGTLHEFDE